MFLHFQQDTNRKLSRTNNQSIIYLFRWILQDLLYTAMEADCHIFLENLVYQFFQFTISNMSLDALGISFPMSLSLSEKPGITITNALYLVFHTKNLV